MSQTNSKVSNWTLDKPSPDILTTQYAEKVVEGNIVASKKNILAAKRHLHDLQKQGTEDFPWVFDKDKAHRPIRFIEKFCKPSKGAYESLIIQPWQHFVVGSLYGWVHKDTGNRRFKEGLIFVARKGGKSTLISGLSNYAISKDGENGADIYLLANSKQQSSIIFEEAKAMVKKSPSLSKMYRPKQYEILYEPTFSKIEPRASDSEKLDGLNSHHAIFDEIHEFKDYKLINVMKNSTSSRQQPMIMYITTAGYQLDGPLVDMYEKGSDVLDGVIQDDRVFYFMAELDEEDSPEDIETNPDILYKANPNLGVTMQKEDMLEEWESRKHVPAERNDFITKRLNMFVDSGEQSFLDYETIKKNEKVINKKELSGRSCVGGFDLSTSEDFTSAVLEFPMYETGEIFVLQHSWIPNKKMLDDNEKIPYREWQDEGLLTVCNSEYVEYEQILQWFVDMAKEYKIDQITYDPANAYRLVKDLESYGFNMQLVRQGAFTLSPALKDIKELFLDGKVVSNKDRLLRWYINNVQLQEDRNENWMPSKQNRYRKIDGFAALLNAHTEVMNDLSEPQGDGDISVMSMADLMK